MTVTFLFDSALTASEVTFQLRGALDGFCCKFFLEIEKSLAF
jgi:hypothetical protein